MIHTFHDANDPKAHSAFQSWRRANIDGYFLNCKTSTIWMLHRVTCAHHGDTDWSRREGNASLTKFKKICSADIGTLLEFGRKSDSIEISFCKNCVPGTSIDSSLALAGQAKQLADEGFFDPHSVIDARRQVVTSIVRRQGQPAFRRKLLEIYGGECSISKCRVESVLDAAHIIPYRGPKTNHPCNGLLLRTDLHTLFDLKLIAVDTKSMKIVLSPLLKGTSYEELRGTKLRIPDIPSCRPSCAALDQHRAESGL